jgi:hypothetical protein
MIEVYWDGDTYIVTQDGEFIKDSFDLHAALEFALAVAAANFQNVTILSVE